MFRTEKQGAVRVVSSDGPLNRETLEEFNACVEGCFREGTPMIVIDMAAIPLIDGGGLEALLEVAERAVTAGGDMKVAAPSSLCFDAMRITGTAEAIDLHESVSAAVGSFAR